MLKVVMNWMVKKLRWFIIPLAINPGLLLLILLPHPFQPTLATISTSLPPALPSSSTARPALIPEVGPSPIPQSRNSPIFTSQQLQPVASSSRRREELSCLPLPAAQVFQQREC
ncbi:hypothetical protein O181_006047 [Austropuccinia psidii MF-1]|uniref:Uncharacterized protein n=1 Tax=Austropuccinia psidii MF-1 TaxID=1389203 RepID=A0A9Q3GH87_9BASI|nr:hypothetical protein [Austropuccinia psidii MF-1]